jgi:DNA-binding beta-propeller fold protein YncE
MWQTAIITVSRNFRHLLILFKNGVSRGSLEGEFKKIPSGGAADFTGNIYVTDSENHRVQKFDCNGNFIRAWGEEGTEQGMFNGPFGIAVSSEGYIHVADTLNNRIQTFDSNGTFIREFGVQGKGKGEFESPEGVCVDSHGNIYVADTENHRIQKFDREGNFITLWGEEGDDDGQFKNPLVSQQTLWKYYVQIRKISVYRNFHLSRKKKKKRSAKKSYRLKLKQQKRCW